MYFIYVFLLGAGFGIIRLLCTKSGADGTDNTMQFILLATVLASLSQLGAAQTSNFHVSCDKSIFAGGLPDGASQRQAAIDICTNPMQCVGAFTKALSEGPKLEFSCDDCPVGLAEDHVSGCKITPE
ncbi:hypothetical protein BUE80_DR012704 [Diplocarpon rosae]|nr:hypothetical protein BUE80_DR012704 [Diplocarpon rosae]